MNEIKIFENTEFGNLKDIEKKNKGKHTGFFYILEWDNKVKIGSTKYPYQRVMALKRSAENYGKSKIGRIALSVPHTNYTENERILHKFFTEHRKDGSELFGVGFEETVTKIPGDIQCVDDSEEIEKQAESFLNRMKKFMLGGVAQ